VILQTRSVATPIEGRMEHYTIDPLKDPRWESFVDGHPNASVFHRREWLAALASSYQYEPIVVTSSRPDEPLKDGLALCRVASWLTGKRLVSLPFSDHCDPLLSSSCSFHELGRWLQAECERDGMRYAEIRPLSSDPNGIEHFSESAAYCFHWLDLSPPLDRVFEGLHKDSMQRRIRKAEREGLSYETGHSPALLEAFYRLLVKTRLRHGVLPQPRAWFQSLANLFRDRLVVHLARSQGIAIAALLTMRHRTTGVYKYGCSDERFHNLGGMPFLFWKFFEESKAAGVEMIDLGRSDLDNSGLLTFKDRMGAQRRRLAYLRYEPGAEHSVPARAGLSRMARFARLVPEAVRPAAGRLLYRHFG
jgi:Acetyltransferase (GNAT) domain